MLMILCQPLPNRLFTTLNQQAGLVSYDCFTQREKNLSCAASMDHHDFRLVPM